MSKGKFLSRISLFKKKKRYSIPVTSSTVRQGNNDERNEIITRGNSYPLPKAIPSSSGIQSIEEENRKVLLGKNNSSNSIIMDISLANNYSPPPPQHLLNSTASTSTREKAIPSPISICLNNSKNVDSSSNKESSNINNNSIENINNNIDINLINQSENTKNGLSTSSLKNESQIIELNCIPNLNQKQSQNSNLLTINDLNINNNNNTNRNNLDTPPHTPLTSAIFVTSKSSLSSSTTDSDFLLLSKTNNEDNKINNNSGCNVSCISSSSSSGSSCNSNNCLGNENKNNCSMTNECKIINNTNNSTQNDLVINNNDEEMSRGISENNEIITNGKNIYVQQVSEASTSKSNIQPINTTITPPPLQIENNNNDNYLQKSLITNNNDYTEGDDISKTEELQIDLGLEQKSFSVLFEKILKTDQSCDGTNNEESIIIGGNSSINNNNNNSSNNSSNNNKRNLTLEELIESTSSSSLYQLSQQQQQQQQQQQHPSTHLSQIQMVTSTSDSVPALVLAPASTTTQTSIPSVTVPNLNNYPHNTTATATENRIHNTATNTNSNSRKEVDMNDNLNIKKNSDENKKEKLMDDEKDDNKHNEEKDTSIKKVKNKYEQYGIFDTDDDESSQQNTVEGMKVLNNTIELVKCGICLDILLEPKIVEPCGHSFCNRCLRLLQNRTCPLCRTRIHDYHSSILLNEICELLAKYSLTPDQLNERKQCCLEIEEKNKNLNSECMRLIELMDFARHDQVNNNLYSVQFNELVELNETDDDI